MLVKNEGHDSAVRWVLVLVFALAATVAWAGEATEETEFNTNPAYLSISPRQNQTQAQQLSDQAECYGHASEYVDWDPYLAYAELTDLGYARALSGQDMEEGLVCLVMAGAVAGDIAGSIVGPENEDVASDGNTLKSAAMGAALGAALGSVDLSFLYEPDDPQAQRAVSQFERDLNRWTQKYSGCLRQKGYQVSSEQ